MLRSVRDERSDNVGHSYQIPLSVEEIQEILPHRYPFLFVDRVSEFEDGVFVVAHKNVSANELFFQGHFPGRPIMPGVLVLEALAQVGVLFAKLSTGGVPPERLMVFSGVDKVKFRRQVVPGDVLTLKVMNYRRKMVHWKLDAYAYVGDDLAAQAVIKATEVL